MTYEETINWLYTRLPMFLRVGSAAFRPEREDLRNVDNHFNRQHQNYKTIHVAGTNGKGSVSHYLAAILQQHGYVTGLYTSPHLRDFRERIRVNGEMIAKEYIVEFIEKHRPFIEQKTMSFFVATTMLAFDYFAAKKVDVAIIEVGLGGRLDSTNVIIPELSVITNISFDHMAILGSGLEQIAHQKAGIIKANVPVVIGEALSETKPVFLAKATEQNAPIYFAEDNYRAESLITEEEKLNTSHQNFRIYRNNSPYINCLKTDLLGNYQQKNISTVLQACEVLKDRFCLKQDLITSAIESTAHLTNLMGRWQIIGRSPLTICDTAHNIAGLEQVVNQLNNVVRNKLHIVFGMVKEKDISSILKLLPTDAIYYFTKANIPRAADENEILEEAAKFNLKGSAYPSVSKALEAARSNATADDLIFIGGSTFVVAEAI